MEARGHMSIRHYVVPISTTAGAATVYSEPVDGELLAIRAILGTLASGAVDIVITDDASGMALLTISNLAADTDYHPRAAAVTVTNGAITNSFVKIPVSGKIKSVVAQAVGTQTGTLHYWVEQE